MKMEKRNWRMKAALVFVCGALFLTACAKPATEGEKKTSDNAESQPVSQVSGESNKDASKTAESSQAVSASEQSASAQASSEEVKDAEKKEEEEKMIAQYKAYAQDFHKLSVEEIKEKAKQGESFLLYVGRATCSDCRRVISSLHKITQENNLEVFYLDCDDPGDKETYRAFIKENKIEEIPYLALYDENGKAKAIDFDFNSIDPNGELIKALTNAGVLKNQKG